MWQLQQTYPRDHGFKFRWKVAVGNSNGKAAQLEHAIRAVAYRWKHLNPVFIQILSKFFILIHACYLK